ncbi:MAG: molecular chaperone DnaJ [SAR202 cluster bacterium]|nr:molecular chaperone DnaJ [SAR202 cluster bacterium]
MTTKRDYYVILEVPRSASEEEIRKAFRKKALEYHPDRNKATDAAERFKEVNEAYQVLTDPERRSQYDRFGHAATRGAPGGRPQGFEDADLFGGFGDIFDAFFGNGFGGAARGRPRQGRDLETALHIEFEEAVFGAKKEIEIQRTDRCSRCKGMRAEPGSPPQACVNCHGSGRVRRAQRSVFGQFVTEAPCNVCGGTGQTIPVACAQCKGAGRERVKKKLSFNVPAGIEDGMQLNLQGEGDAGDAGAPPGDLQITVRVAPHPVFHRQNDDIVYLLDISFPHAALGTEVEVPTLRGKEKLKVPPGTQTGAVFYLKGQGVPHLNRPTTRGDEIVTVRVATPEKLTKRQRELLEELQRTIGEESADKGRGWFGKN